MNKILIFGGTTEGRELAEFCIRQQFHAVVSVATAYGSDLLPHSEFLEVLTGRKNAEEIAEMLIHLQPVLIIDATHPYAEKVTENIQSAASRTGICCLRLLRQRGESFPFGEYFPDYDSILKRLEQTSGAVFLTIGSKDLARFCMLKNWKTRCFARILPQAESLAFCLSLGFPRDHLFVEQGPFSAEQNLAHLRSCKAEFLITKESGKAGGFPEKMTAAKQAGATPLILSRPVESGFSLDEIREMLKDRLLPENQKTGA